MKILTLGYHFQHENHFQIHRPNGAGDYVLMIVPSAAFFVLDGKRVLSEPNSVIIYRKDTPQLYGAADGIFINHWIHFDLSEEELLELEVLNVPFDTVLSFHDVTPFAQIVKSMSIEKYSVNPHREESLNLLFKLLYLKISESLQVCSEWRNSPYYEKISLIRSKIYRNPSNARSIAALAQELMLSESYFQHLYKQIFGVSVMSDVIAARIEYGKYLLANTDSSVGDIATQCGYASDVHFMRQFKSTAGVTPSQYRKQFRIPFKSASTIF